MAKRIEINEDNLLKKRGMIPLCLPDFRQNVSAPCHPCLQAFEIISDEATNELIAEALKKPSLPEILDALGDVLQVDKASVALFDCKGEKFRVRSSYNPDFIDGIKKIGWASFYKPATTWSLPETQESAQGMSELLRETFSAVVNLDTMQAYRISEDSQSHTATGFHLLPSHVEVNAREVAQAITTASGRAWSLSSVLYMHNGVEFEGIDLEAVVHTRLPFLVFRVSGLTGMPVTASYSTVARMVEAVGYEKSASKLIARFKTGVYVVGEAPCAADRSQPLLDPGAMAAALSAPCEMVSVATALVSESLSDMRFAPLNADYLSLAEKDLGAELSEKGVMAYACLRPKAHVRAIATVAGYGQDDRIVVYNREMLPRSTQEAMSVSIHEAAHHICAEHRELLEIQDAHGPQWALCATLLAVHVQKGRPLDEGHLDYANLGDAAKSRLLDALVTHGLPALPPTQSLSSLVIAQIAKSCLSRAT